MDEHHGRRLARDQLDGNESADREHENPDRDADAP
jgi:hypothetical protein